MKSITEESKSFRDQLVRSILALNTKGINRMDYLTPCSVEGANKLRTKTWGAELHGVTMAFVAEQFIMQESVCEADVSKSIIFRPDEELFPRLWIIKSKRPLYIGSRAFVKINRGAITGLPEG